VQPGLVLCFMDKVLNLNTGQLTRFNFVTDKITVHFHRVWIELIMDIGLKTEPENNYSLLVNCTTKMQTKNRHLNRLTGYNFYFFCSNTLVASDYNAKK
jgi:hypothetical protein